MAPLAFGDPRQRMLSKVTDGKESLGHFRLSPVPLLGLTHWLWLARGLQVLPSLAQAGSTGACWVNDWPEEAGRPAVGRPGQQRAGCWEGSTNGPVKPVRTQDSCGHPHPCNSGQAPRMPSLGVSANLRTCRHHAVQQEGKGQESLVLRAGPRCSSQQLGMTPQNQQGARGTETLRKSTTGYQTPSLWLNEWPFFFTSYSPAHSSLLPHRLAPAFRWPPAYYLPKP